MKVNELVSMLKTTYDCNLNTKSGCNRIYFNHKPKVCTYIELETNGNEVIDSKADCYYFGKPPTNYNWIKNYKRSAEKFIHSINADVHILINQQKEKGGE